MVFPFILSVETETFRLKNRHEATISHIFKGFVNFILERQIIDN